MADTVAIVSVVSVVSTTALAGGSILVTYLNGKKQREHEAALAFEERIWERKSQALFEVIASCRRLADAIDRRPRGEQAVAAAHALNDLHPWVPVVESLASRDCRDEFAGLLDVLRHTRPDQIWLLEADEMRVAKEVALETMDFTGAAHSRQQEVDALAQVGNEWTADPDDLKARADRVIEQARISVRRSAES